MKTCTKCGLVKDLSEFYRDRNRRDGHGASCRLCDLSRMAARRRAEPQIVRGLHRAWKEKTRLEAIEKLGCLLFLWLSRYPCFAN